MAATSHLPNIDVPRMLRRTQILACQHLLTAQRLLLAFTLCAANFPASALGEPPADSPATASASSENQPTGEDVQRWIADLGNDAYSVRQDAAERLRAAGMLARQPLLDVAAGPDPETRASARRLVALIDRTEFRRRVDAFAADTDGKLGLTLPGWGLFQTSVGSDAAARALFVDMQRQEGALLAIAFGPSNRAAQSHWEFRLQRIAQWQIGGDRAATPAMGSCAAMIFLGTLPEMNVSDIAAHQIQTILQRPPLKDVLTTDTSQIPARKLVINWLLQCPNQSEDVLRQRLGLIASNGLKDALPLALRICDGDPQFLQIQPLTRAVAILIVGQLGGREHIARLEPLLEDSAVCVPLQVQVPGRPPISVQVRDVALNVMLSLSGQSPAEYGYTGAQMASSRTFNLQTLYRDNDDQRAEAIAKWRAWRAEHRDDSPAPATP